MGTLPETPFIYFLKFIKRSKVKDFDSLHESDCGHDVLISIKPNETDEHPEGYVKSHRLLLSMLSPVFKQQCFGPWASSATLSRNKMLNISIVGYSFKVVRRALEFLYTGDNIYVDSTSLRKLFEIYRFGDQFDCKKLCEAVELLIVSSSFPWHGWNIDIRLVLEYEQLSSHEGLCKCVGFRCAKKVHQTFGSVRDVTAFVAKELNSPEAKYIMKMLDSCSICRSDKECRHHPKVQERILKIEDITGNEGNDYGSDDEDSDDEQRYYHDDEWDDGEEEQGNAENSNSASEENVYLCCEYHQSKKPKL